MELSAPAAASEEHDQVKPRSAEDTVSNMLAVLLRRSAVNDNQSAVLFISLEQPLGSHRGASGRVTRFTIRSVRLSRSFCLLRSS